jgi:two-component system, chemotaxis family, protein-glutamate methylesterase/glutaminase
MEAGAGLRTPVRRTIAPGSRIRVLVVDDSVVIRRLVKHALTEDPSIEVVGAAPNGAVAMQLIPQLNPDAITLDVEMPEMDGLETLIRLRKLYPSLVVIMFSTLTARGAEVTIDALTHGANDYVTKAANVGSLDQSLEKLRSELVPKIRQFFTFSEAPRRPAVAAAPFRKAVTPRAVGIAVSTGGPAALASIIPQLPPAFPLPVLITQHMPPLFTRLLADRLQAITTLKVSEAVHGQKIESGHIYVAPGDYHLKAARRGVHVQVELDQGPPENSCRPAADVMFRSMHDVWGGGVIAAVLTGMGHDGLRGVELLRHEGAAVIAQDQDSSVVWGMPGAVASAGLADSIVDLSEVVPEILKRV